MRVWRSVSYLIERLDKNVRNPDDEDWDLLEVYREPARERAVQKLEERRLKEPEETFRMLRKTTTYEVVPD